jgi:hypothetical protein
MPLPISGSISMSSVNTEIGSSSTATIGLNDSGPRALAGISSGTISMNDLRGALLMNMGYAYTYSTWGGVIVSQYGYYSGAFGSLATTTFPDGRTVGYIMDEYFGGGSCQIMISGFPSDPGKTGYFSSIKKQGGNTLTSATSSYSYGAGYAYWTWGGSILGFTTSGVAYCKFTA